MIALVDGDLVAFRCAASCEKKDKEGNLLSLEPLEIACMRSDKLTREILEQANADHYKMFLSGQDNFRYKIYPEYKANRPEERPVHLEDTRAFLISEWNAKLVNGYEADDALGIAQTDETIICSLDKDLKMVPGRHFSWQISGRTVSGAEWVREAEFSEVDELDGLRTFYKQMLIGDKSDNIIGVDGLGPKKSAKLIDSLEEEQDMFDTVLDKYNYDYDRFLVNGTCLWIMQNEGETWLHRLTSNVKLPQEMVQKYESMKSLLST